MDERQLNLSGNKVLSKREEKNAGKDFIESVMSIFRPKIVHPMWMERPPEKLNTDILIDRMKLAINKERLASQFEALWYISTCSLVASLDRDWSDIMMYLCRRWVISNKKEIPDFLREPIELDDMQERYLYDLRHWLYKKGMEKVH